MLKKLFLWIFIFSSLFWFSFASENAKVENINFKDYATQIRIEKTKMILETSDGNVTEVAEKLGYTDVSYFSYAFKKKTGYSPKEYYSNKVGNKVLG